MPALTQKEQTDFLEEDGILMRIGVVREDGTPLVTPIWFIMQKIVFSLLQELNQSGSAV